MARNGETWPAQGPPVDFQRLVECSEEAVFQIDPGGRYLFINRAGAMLLGRKPEAIVGLHLLDVLPAAAGDLWVQMLQQVLHTREWASAEHPLAVQGEERHYATTLIPVLGERGEVASVIGFGRDLTASRRAQEALQARNQQLEAIASLSAETIRELDLKRLLRLIVEHAVALLGCKEGGLTLWDEEQQVMVPHAMVGLDDWMGGLRMRPGEGLVGVMAELRMGVIVDDYLGWSRALPAFQGREASLAAIGEPLIYQEHLLGAIVINNEGVGRRFTTEDQGLLRLFANQAAIAVQNANVFAQMRSGRQRLQDLSRRLVEVQEQERRHVARELHDEVGQLLTALKLVLETSPAAAGGDLDRKLREAKTLVGDLLGRVRELSLRLRPSILDDLGLLPALNWHLERFTSQSGIGVDLRHSGLDRRFPAEVETAAYRIVQEALTNVARHAGVDRVTVSAHATTDIVTLEVEDLGAGFDPEATLVGGGSSGLAGMRERALALGGKLVLDSAQGRGTRLTAELPLAGRTERRKSRR